ncbi:MAG: molybdenum cofactor synthesis domain [Acidobacteria bacterium]|nr:molybdenum cofactor synthesis domain [Acidobacteriota bacterium]
MKPLAEAQREILAAMALLREAEVPLGEALGLCLTGDVAAPHPVPPFANSAADGFAVRAADVAAAPVELEVLEDVPAGHPSARALRAGAAVRIMTGAPLPEGADATVMVEHTAAAGPGRVRVEGPVAPGEGVRPAGSDLPAGALVFSAGERLTPGHLGVLASLGVARPRVRRRPRVAVLSTGDEVVPPETADPAPGLIRDANGPLLAGMLADLGAEVLDLGIVGDDAAQLADVLASAAGSADAVVTSGGVSVGDYDLVKQVLAGIGGVAFWRVALQPGKPFAFGFLGDTPFFGLPGNPVSVMVSFEQLVRPALLRCMGARALFRPRVRGWLTTAVSTDPDRTVFLRVNAAFREGRWEAAPSGAQGSHVLSALARADAFAVVPSGVGELPSGAGVDLEMFRWPEARTMEEALG